MGVFHWWVGSCQVKCVEERIRRHSARPTAGEGDGGPVQRSAFQVLRLFLLILSYLWDRGRTLFTRAFAGICIGPFSGMGFPAGSDSKESACNAGDLGSIPGLGASPGGRHGYPLQYSCVENPHGLRSLVGYSPWGHKESDTTEQPSTQHTETI